MRQSNNVVKTKVEFRETEESDPDTDRVMGEAKERKFKTHQN